jgi:antibiotic biosynthesis monooxygenase
VLVVNRFRVGRVAADGREPAAGGPAAGEFAARAREALAAFAARPGFLDGQLGRAADDPSWWCLVTRWESVGAYRRALGDFQVRLAATALLADSVEEPAAYEVLAHTESGQVRTFGSDREPGGGQR